MMHRVEEFFPADSLKKSILMFLRWVATKGQEAIKALLIHLLNKGEAEASSEIGSVIQATLYCARQQQ